MTRLQCIASLRSQQAWWQGGALERRLVREERKRNRRNLGPRVGPGTGHPLVPGFYFDTLAAQAPLPGGSGPSGPGGGRTPLGEQPTYRMDIASSDFF